MAENTWVNCYKEKVIKEEEEEEEEEEKERVNGKCGYEQTYIHPNVTQTVCHPINSQYRLWTTPKPL